MIVHLRCQPEGIDPAVNARITREVTHALQAIRTSESGFVVNDSLWYGQRPDGKVTPRVMNTAGFLSGTFTATLQNEFGWKLEKEFDDQKIDGFTSISVNRSSWRIASHVFPEYFRIHCANEQPVDVRKEFLRYWHLFVRVGIGDIAELDASRRSFFVRSAEETVNVNVGLEFETGNIASSFRALGKLEMLFAAERIDYGVFVTSIDKANAAGRIWPISNRNGSFAELENRNYRRNLTVPLWEFGFQPDEFRPDALFIGPDGLYSPTETGKRKTIEGIEYEVFRRGKEQLLRRPSSQ